MLTMVIITVVGIFTYNNSAFFTRCQYHNCVKVHKIRRKSVKSDFVHTLDIIICYNTVASYLWLLAYEYEAKYRFGGNNDLRKSSS